jgi:hypothetical protein
MSKKSKRQVRRDASISPDKIVPEVLSGNRPTGFNPDYQFVIRDVRRVGLLAGFFIVTLVALSFILH